MGVYRMTLRLEAKERLALHSEKHQPRSLRKNCDIHHITTHPRPPAPAGIAHVQPAILTVLRVAEIGVAGQLALPAERKMLLPFRPVAGGCKLHRTALIKGKNG